MLQESLLKLVCLFCIVAFSPALTFAWCCVVVTSSNVSSINVLSSWYLPESCTVNVLRVVPSGLSIPSMGSVPPWMSLPSTCSPLSMCCKVVTSLDIFFINVDRIVVTPLGVFLVSVCYAVSTSILTVFSTIATSSDSSSPHVLCN